MGTNKVEFDSGTGPSAGNHKQAAKVRYFAAISSPAKFACLWCILVFSFVVQVSGVSFAGELDTAWQCYNAIRDGLGETAYGKGIDSTTASFTYLRNALNAGLRAVQTDIPFTGKDTLTVTANTFIYTLNGALVQPPENKPGEKWQPSGYSVVLVYPDGDLIGGIEEKPMDQVGFIPYAVTSPWGFHVRGSEFYFWPADPATATIYVFGPGETTQVIGSGTAISNPPETSDRWAAVYHAIATIASERNDDAKYQQYRGQYTGHVLARTGQMPASGGP